MNSPLCPSCGDKKTELGAPMPSMPPEEENLAVKKSPIPGAGYGLFATRRFKKGEWITPYYGFVSKQPPQDTKYSIYLPQRHAYLDAPDSWNCAARFANDAEGSSKLKKENNVTFASLYSKNGDERGIWLKAIRDVPKGAEILVSYGSGYWRSRSPGSGTSHT